MRLIRKMIIPHVCVVAVLGLISFVVIYNLFNSIKEHYIVEGIKDHYQFILSEIEVSSQTSIREASLFSALPIVEEAYDIALSGDINDPASPQVQAARDLLRKELAPMLDNHYAVTGERLRLHFHLPNGYSFVRLWREVNADIDGVPADISDDLNLIRSTVADTNRTGEVTRGIEAGSAGLAIRGVLPVTASDGRHIGSVEVVQDFDWILNAAANKGNLSVALYANVELLDFSSELRDEEKHPHVGDFVQVAGSTNDSFESLQIDDILVRGKNEDTYDEIDKAMIAAYPLEDYKGNQVGVFVFAKDASIIAMITTSALLVLILMLIGSTVLTTAALISRTGRLVMQPLSMIKNKIQDIAEDRADLSDKISSGQKDEIGELAGWFDTLTTKLEAILDERQSMLTKISLESDKFESMAHWYVSILDSVPFPISVQNYDMEWTFFNSALEKMLGKDRDSMLGVPCSSWNNSICNTEHCAIECAKRGQSQTGFTFEGASHLVDVAVLKDLQGNSTGFIEVIRDVTEMEMLMQQAQAANLAKSNFLANMSHEIRTPLNAIIGMTSIGLSTASPVEMNKCYMKIMDASKHLLGIINDILDMSKIESGNFELSLIEFDFAKMINTVLSVISFRINEKQQNLNVTIDENIPRYLVGDDMRLSQVITNLLSNATKFTPEHGTIGLDVQFISERDGFYEIQCSISDTGIGIHSDQFDRLFQSFQQAESDTTRKYGGTGLGLVISKSIVNMMGGDIWIDSELDNGSTFTFNVRLEGGQRVGRLSPVAASHMDEVNALEPDEDPDVLSKKYAGAFANQRILLVEDVEINREIVSALLKPTSIEIDYAEDGLEAVRKFREAPDKYGLIFMDVQMPNMDGYEATRRIREIEARDAEARGAEADVAVPVPIIAMTANVFREDVDRCLESGMNGHIGKPLQLNEILVQLKVFLPAA